MEKALEKKKRAKQEQDYQERQKYLKDLKKTIKDHDKKEKIKQEKLMKQAEHERKTWQIQFKEKEQR